MNRTLPSADGLPHGIGSPERGTSSEGGTVSFAPYLPRMPRPTARAFSPAPRIDPVPKAMDRPFWSVMIPVYNGANFLRKTLESVLRQDAGPAEMQIQVIDNCSEKDDPGAVVARLAGTRVQFHRQPKNVGVVENFNECIRRATGEWVHILHADDTVRAGFYQRLRAGIEAHPMAGAATCRFIHMDEDDVWTAISELEARTPGLLGKDYWQRMFVQTRFQSATIVVRRSVYEHLGGFRAEFAHCTDWDMWKRIAMHHQIFYEPEPLACYRVHSSADSSQLIRTAKNVVDQRGSIRMSCADLPSQDVKPLLRAAMKQAGIRAMADARRLWAEGEHAAAWRQLQEGLRCSLTPAVLARAGLFFAKMVVR